MASVAFAQSGEFRGVWVSRFEWPDRDQAKCKAKIDEIMKTLAAHNFNAVVFQVRGQCDTLYPSPEEPWSPHISPDGSDPGWDPMAYAIEAAHANKLEFHAYINTHVAWQHSKKAAPVAQSHIYYKHFNATDPNACDWAVHNGEGKPIVWGGDSYVWIAPGVPEAQAYTRRQVMYVVNKYDIDGVHFDRIRTPTADCSRDPISVARSENGAEGNPAGLDFAKWTDDQFTRFVCDMYAQIVEAKPQVRVSSAPLGLVTQDRYPNYPAGFHYGVTKCHQDAQAWLAAGGMDFVVPQIYWADNDKKAPNFSEVLPDWVAHAAGRQIYAGHSTGVGVAELMNQVKVTRELGGLGNIVFSYGSFKSKQGFEQYSKAGSVYEKPVGTPAMPWKDAPSEGIILGTVKDVKTGEPVTDAQIRRNGSDYVALSSADGVFSMLKVTPGQYTLTVTKAGLPELKVENLTVAAGKVVRAEVALGGEPAVIASAEKKEEAAPAETTDDQESAAETSEASDKSEKAAETEPSEVAQTDTSAENASETAEPSEAQTPRPMARQLETTVEVQSRPMFVRYLLLGLIVAGLGVGAAAVVVALKARR